MLSKILPSIGGLQGLIDAIKAIIGGGGTSGGNQYPNLQMEFSKSPHDFLHGEVFAVAVGGMKPNTQTDYVWSTLGKIGTVMTDGTGSFTHEIIIFSTTAAGSYTVTFDQRPYGGPAIYNTLRVLSSGVTTNYGSAGVQNGSNFKVFAAGLKPSTNLIYYWEEAAALAVVPGASTGSADNSGLWNQTVSLPSNFPTGSFHLRVNQKPFGGTFEKNVAVKVI